MESKFAEFTRWEDEPICIKKEDISAFYPDPSSYRKKEVPTIITTGTNTYIVNESYEVVKKRILGLEQKDRVYQIPFKEPDKEWIEKSLEEWRRKYYDVMPLRANTFAEVGYQQPADTSSLEKMLEEWNKIGCTTFSSLGMTDDEWHKAVAGLSE